MPIRSTIRDVAAEAGVSKSAVSLVLRNQPGVSEATRRKVRAAMETLDYVPDPALSRIAAHRWKSAGVTSGTSIALIKPTPTSGAGLLDLRWEGAKEECLRLGYHVETVDWSPQSQFPSLTRQLYHRGVQGILLPPLRSGMGFEETDWSRFSIVSIGRGRDFFPVHAVAPDAFNNTRLCWRNVRELGYRRVGCAPLSHGPMIEDDAARYGAFAFAQQLETARHSRVPILTSNLQDKAAFLKWLHRYRPEVVIGFGGNQLGWMRGDGWKVPEDVSYASLHAHEYSDAPTAEKTAGISTTRRELGKAAVLHLDMLLRTNQRGLPDPPLTHHLESHWSPGESCPPCQS